MKVYLAGPITGISYEGATSWRRNIADFIRRRGGVALSPMRGKDYLASETVLEKDYGNLSVMSSPRGIYGRDSFDVRQCDILFVNLLGAKNVSIGTIMEIQMGHDFGKYVLVLMDDDGVHDHPFVREAASIVVSTEAEALSVLDYVMMEK